MNSHTMAIASPKTGKAPAATPHAKAPIEVMSAVRVTKSVKLAAEPRIRKAGSPSVAKTVKKVPPASGVSESSPQGLEDRTSNAWLVRDDKALLAAVAGGDDVFTAGRALRREPMSVLRHLNDESVAIKLDAQGLGLEFSSGSEEETELFGLALAGVPLGMSLRWCRGDETDAGRPSAADLQANMSSADLRPALALVQSLGLWFVQARQIEALRVLSEEPLARVRSAVEAVIARFDAPTPNAVAQQLFGVQQPVERPYPWMTANAMPLSLPEPSRNRKKSSGTYRSKPKKASSPSKYRRKSVSGAKKTASSSTSRKRYWGRKRGTSASKGASHSAGTVGPDTRTAAEKAWEKKTSW